MVKGAAAVQPDQTLDFFVPHLCSRIESILGDRCSASDKQKVDTELQFNILMLSEVISVKMLSVLPLRPSSVLFQHIEKLCQVFDKILVLDLKDEYEVASNALENLLFNIVHMRPLQNYYTSKVISRFVEATREAVKQPRNNVDFQWQGLREPHTLEKFFYLQENLVWSKEEFAWGKSQTLEELRVKWYTPGKEELEVVQNLFERYFRSQLDLLEQWIQGKKELEKEEILRTLRQIYKIIHGSSELLPSISTGPFQSSLSTNLKSLKSSELTFKGGIPIRQTVLECMQKAQKHLLATTPDDTDALNAIVAVYDVLLFSFGLDEDELNDHMEVIIPFRILSENQQKLMNLFFCRNIEPSNFTESTN